MNGNEQAVIEAAINLESWLSKNVGYTDDWPVHLHTDNEDYAIKLSELLTSLTMAKRSYLEGLVKNLCPECGHELMKSKFKDVAIYICKNDACQKAFSTEEIEYHDNINQ